MASRCSSSLNNATNKKRALFIGNNKYAYGPKLQYCINDATDLANELRSINFQITIGTDRTYEQMDLMIEEFLDTIRPGDLVLFFFSGHGHQWEGYNFLMPIDDHRIDSPKMIKHRAINAQVTLERIMDRRPSAAIFLLDCCRSYLVRNSVQTKGSNDTNGLSTMRAVAGSFIAFACDAGQTVVDGSANQKNGIFTAHLLKHITEPNLSIDEIMYDICDGVMKESDDHQCPFRISSLRRKVYLNKTIQVVNSTLINLHPNTKWKQNGITIAGGNGKGDRINQLSSPYGIYVDDDQTIYTADCENHRIVAWKYDSETGQVVAGGNGQGNRRDQLNQPTDVIVDKKNDSLIICDHGNRRVVRWSRRNDTSGQTIISDIQCSCVTMDKNGDLYVSDGVKNEVRRWRKGESSGRIVAGGNGEGDHPNQLNYPTSIFVDDDYSLYVSDERNHRVMKWMQGAKEGIIVAGGNGEGNRLTQLCYPRGVIVDQLGHVYVTEGRNHRVMRWCKGAKEGNIVVGANGEGNQSNQFSYPQSLSFDRQGNLYVADWSNNRIQQFKIDSN